MTWLSFSTKAFLYLSNRNQSLVPMDPIQTYQEDLWTKIRRLPFLVAMAMEGAARSGISGSARERHAMIESIIRGRYTYPGNEIINAIVPNGLGREELELEMARQHDDILDCMQEQDICDQERFRQHILKVLTLVTQTLDARESAETSLQYRTWLLDIAKKVAEAAKEGDFLGIGGSYFSEKERAFYKLLEERLL
jgi:hypothetical protein